MTIKPLTTKVHAPWEGCLYDLYAHSFFLAFPDPPSEGVSSGYESMRCESSAKIHSSDSSSEKGKSPRSKGKDFDHGTFSRFKAFYDNGRGQ